VALETILAMWSREGSVCKSCTQVDSDIAVHNRSRMMDSDDDGGTDRDKDGRGVSMNNRLFRSSRTLLPSYPLFPFPSLYILFPSYRLPLDSTGQDQKRSVNSWKAKMGQLTRESRLTRYIPRRVKGF